jgi:hypothetical protein
MTSFTKTITNYDKYYTVEGSVIKYHNNFPQEWAKNHLVLDDEQTNGSGPEKCGNCDYFGTCRGVFIGYCANCAENMYNGERGEGCVAHFVSGEEPQLWSSLPYMQGVNIEDIGLEEDETIHFPTQEEIDAFYDEPKNENDYEDYYEYEEEQHYGCEYLTPYELVDCPQDMRNGLDPKYAERLEIFRLWAREEM